ncbi:uncharacterized protein LOC126554940 [Aphis gossypii]|uniref:uncharacterized protein LOC126554940 n=1 Tax=Aphis gossypii TaxID=80765 RepID=UPI0021597641|nr:uncharacterized protein LOC126554940 [Aphis gossypii]
MDEDSGSNDTSPMKRNPRGKFIGSRQKLMIVNLYKAKMAQQKNADGPKLKAKEIIKIISEESGIGQRTVSITLSEYRNKGSVSSPNKTKVQPTVTEKVEDFDLIRKKVHEFWHRREIPTLKKILTAVNKDTKFFRNIIT